MLATSCKELTRWKRPWYWEGLGAGGEGADRGRRGWIASPTRWTWVWVNSRSWWWTGRPDVLWFMGSQRVRHDWATKLNWTEFIVGLPRWFSGEESTCQCRRCGFNPWVRKIPQRRKWQPIPVFLPGKSRSLTGCKTVGHDLGTKEQIYSHFKKYLSICFPSMDVCIPT